MSLGLVTIQLGKAGYNEGSRENIKKALEHHNNIKVVVLRSYIRDREQMDELVNRILNDLGEKYTARVVGYSIFLKKWKRKMR
ncbi:YhbY family RNA-binding protein [Candidatus Pacearchaeota archaeon]|nr:YhbY family RNA-binding protein [Candidatus Pacearchaeota archaeon]